jgi:hypothetical protein
MPNGDHYSPPVPALHAGIFKPAGVRIFTRILTGTTGNAIDPKLTPVCNERQQILADVNTFFNVNSRAESAASRSNLEHPAINFRASNDLAFNYNIKDEAASWSLPTRRT